MPYVAGIINRNSTGIHLYLRVFYWDKLLFFSGEGIIYKNFIFHIKIPTTILVDGLSRFRAGRGGQERARFRRRRRATPADPSEVLPRWGKTSVPARNKTRQPRKDYFSFLIILRKMFVMRGSNCVPEAFLIISIACFLLNAL